MFRKLPAKHFKKVFKFYFKIQWITFVKTNYERSFKKFAGYFFAKILPILKFEVGFFSTIFLIFLPKYRELYYFKLIISEVNRNLRSIFLSQNTPALESWSGIISEKDRFSQILENKVKFLIYKLIINEVSRNLQIIFCLHHWSQFMIILCAGSLDPLKTWVHTATQGWFSHFFLVFFFFPRFWKFKLDFFSTYKSFWIFLSKYREGSFHKLIMTKVPRNSGSFFWTKNGLIIIK